MITQNNVSLRQQTIDFEGLSDPIEQNYTYDDLNRLKSAIESVDSTEIWNQTFNYDRFGNRTFDATYTDTFAQSNKVTNPSIDSSTNRITEDQDGGGNDYEYDRNGNLVFNAVDNGYVYDAENRLKEFFADKDDNDPYAVYEYDGNGNRVRKIVDPEGDAVETVFVYNGGGQLVAEYSTELAQAPKVSYLTQDHLGSPRVITDEDGEVVSRHDYLAYGEDLTQQLGAVGGRSSGQGYGAADEIRKKYTGYERDEESGLDYAKARYYDSFRGRYTSVDPLTASADVKNPQTFNRYTYVLNSPYKFTDPLGLISEHTGAYGNRFPGSTGWGGGLIDPYRAEGSTIQVGREVWHRQEQQDPPNLPPPIKPGPPLDTSGFSRGADCSGGGCTDFLGNSFTGFESAVSESTRERNQYNCLAWALGFTDVWIEPALDENGKLWGGWREKRAQDRSGNATIIYKPIGEAGLTQLAPYGLVKIAKAYGAEQRVKVNGERVTASADSATPDGYYKMVAFEGNDPTKGHIMRQESDGSWSSKNGAGPRVIGIRDPVSYYQRVYNPSPEMGVKTTYLFRKLDKLGK